MDTEQQFDDEFLIPEKTINDIKREMEESSYVNPYNNPLGKKTQSVEEMTQAIVSNAKAEVKARYGNRKRHRQ